MSGGRGFGQGSRMRDAAVPAYTLSPAAATSLRILHLIRISAGMRAGCREEAMAKFPAVAGTALLVVSCAAANAR